MPRLERPSSARDMADMPVRRSRSGKDLAASFHRLKRLVGDVKSARRSFVAHHSRLSEVVSVAFYSLSKDPLPRRDLHHVDDPLPSVAPGVSPLVSRRSRRMDQEPPDSPSSKLPSTVPAHRSASLPSQWIFQEPSSLCSSTEPSFPRNPTRASLRPFTSKVSTSFAPSSAKSGCSSMIRPSHQGTESRNSRCLNSGAYPGRRLPQSAFWASLFLVFICFFLCTGKEVAVVLAVGIYILIRIIRSLATDRDNEDSPESDMRGASLCMSSAISAGRKNILFGSSNQESLVRSASSPSLCCLSQGKEHSECLDGLSYLQSSAIVLRDSEHFSARVKLGIILMLALCGLAYGQIVAVCLCSCCILLYANIIKARP
ncbi:hypothetical protein KP509_36G043600 [Ceratopteris richardii]|uniref:Transmembrane protein n=1 Tax=Ceratopteris richardii TaxID=49495 RepID=A0A8T2QCE3_CERRI|nr:hypothetical protein KP509_36G043600 [Ceratopteris richardii]